MPSSLLIPMHGEKEVRYKQCTRLYLLRFQKPLTLVSRRTRDFSNTDFSDEWN